MKRLTYDDSDEGAIDYFKMARRRRQLELEEEQRLYEWVVANRIQDVEFVGEKKLQDGGGEDYEIGNPEAGKVFNQMVAKMLLTQYKPRQNKTPIEIEVVNAVKLRLAYAIDKFYEFGRFVYYPELFSKQTVETIERREADNQDRKWEMRKLTATRFLSDLIKNAEELVEGRNKNFKIHRVGVGRYREECVKNIGDVLDELRYWL